MCGVNLYAGLFYLELWRIRISNPWHFPQKPGVKKVTGKAGEVSTGAGVPGAREADLFLGQSVDCLSGQNCEILRTIY